jgi:uncharacterized SAM-binding protein YcdF (DUF218 family)
VARRSPRTSFAGLIVRAAALLALAWLAGFIGFIASLPAPAPPGVRTQAVIVLTGGPGRLARGVQVLERGLATRMLVSGVDGPVRPAELAAAVRASPRLFTCCIDLGYAATDTRGNADESAAWVKRHGYRSVRLVTAAYHSARATAELAATLGADVLIVADAVPAGLPLAPLAREYSKYLLRWPMLKLGIR